MELFDVMRTTFSAREFTDDPLPDEVLAEIFENARFAPSGGNRQGGRVIVVRDADTRSALADLAAPPARRYVAQRNAGESPWNPLAPTAVPAAIIAETEIPARLTESFRDAPVVLVFIVDLEVVAATDQLLDRVGLIAGASIYPFVWNVLLAARQAGFGGTITTLAVAQEPDLLALLSIPANFAVAAVVPLGKPVKQLTKLRRMPVEEIATHERFDGAPFIV
jgi:nitroreductase